LIQGVILRLVGTAADFKKGELLGLSTPLVGSVAVNSDLAPVILAEFAEAGNTVAH
jgi:hypothetical protein